MVKKICIIGQAKIQQKLIFVVALKNQILPLEVKAGISKQKKSLRVYGENLNLRYYHVQLL